MRLRMAMFRYGRFWDVILPGFILVLIMFMCVAGPLVIPIPPPTGGNVLDANLSLFSAGHVLGTDANGNDVASRLIYGGRASLSIALSVNLAGVIVGGFLGATSAWIGGVVDALIMRVIDALIAIPAIILVLAIAQSLEPSTINVIVALTFISIPAFVRLARTATLQMRSQPFIMAASLSGTGWIRMLVRHVAPNIGPQLFAYAILGTGLVINIEGAVSYLGLGVRPPQPTWGNMIYQGQSTMSADPTLVMLPSVLLFCTVLPLNILGEALRKRWKTA